MTQNVGLLAATFAKYYTSLVTALQREGMEEPKAREEARRTAFIMMSEELEEHCPYCGQDVIYEEEEDDGTG